MQGPDENPPAQRSPSLQRPTTMCTGHLDGRLGTTAGHLSLALRRCPGAPCARNLPVSQSAPWLVPLTVVPGSLEAAACPVANPSTPEEMPRGGCGGLGVRAHHMGAQDAPPC